MLNWKVIITALLVALIVAYASNRGMIPVVNPGAKLPGATG
jgi:hypothetical protein